jgi:hypothetical protein
MGAKSRPHDAGRLRNGKLGGVDPGRRLAWLAVGLAPRMSNHGASAGHRVSEEDDLRQPSPALAADHVHPLLLTFEALIQASS